MLRILSLDERVQDMIEMSKIDLGHAKALCGITNAHQQYMLAREAHKKRLNVRQLEQRVKSLKSGKDVNFKNNKDNDIEALQETLSETFGHPCKITIDKKGGGELIIRFVDSVDFENVVDKVVPDFSFN